MSSPSDEIDALLLGYLLGSLDPQEQAAVAAALQQNAALRDRLAQIAARLHELGMDRRPPTVAPPEGLAERTCQQILGAEMAGWRRRVAAACAAPRELSLRWSDWVALAAVLLAAVSLVLPALRWSRFQAQVALCQNQLRLIGLGLHAYSEAAPDHSFPGPEAHGNRAVAGIVAPLLVDHQWAYPQMFLCPASPVPRRGGFSVPALAEVDRAHGPRLRALQREMGGDYGYNLGYLEAGQLVRPRNLGRSHYILVADAPSNLQPRRVSANHGGRGQNVLYEDGRVQYVFLPLPDLIDDPFHNREGWIAAGVDQEDAVLGVSWDPPLPVPVDP